MPPGALLLSDAERATLGEIGDRLGRKALADVANAAKPDTILGWYACVSHFSRTDQKPNSVSCVGTLTRTTVFECGERRVRSVLKHLIWFELSPALRP